MRVKNEYDLVNIICAMFAIIQPASVTSSPCGQRGSKLVNISGSSDDSGEV